MTAEPALADRFVDADPVPSDGQPADPPRWRGALARFAVLVGAGVIVAAATVAINLTGLETPPVQAPPRAAAPATSAPQPVPDAPADAGPVHAAAPTDRVDPAWAQRVADATGIPTRALLAYASADLTVDAEQPGCGLGWNTLAAIGAIESAHGTHGGAVLGDDGYPVPAIVGIPLDGSEGVAAIADTDDGAWDGDPVWDRAVGPMQFIPSTWARWAADGSGDGVGDPNQVDDAALGAARYLCASGSMGSAQGWRDAVFSYNHSTAYVDQVAATANRYAAAAGSAS